MSVDPQRHATTNPPRPVAAPPRVAIWLLRRLGPRYHREALEGDLLEEFHRRRSRGWFWWQTLAALGVGRWRIGTGVRRLLRAIGLTALTAGAIAWAGTSSQAERSAHSDGSSQVNQEHVIRR